MKLSTSYPQINLTDNIFIYYGWREKGGKWGMEHPRCSVRNAAKPQYIDIFKFPGLYPISNHLSSIIYPTYWAYFVHILI
jgi:hypothetical protein